MDVLLFCLIYAEFWIFILPPLLKLLGVEGPVQSNHCEEKGRRVRLKRDKSMLKAAGVKSKLLEIGR